MLDERKKRQALEAKLAEFEARDAAAERKRLEEAGEHQRLRELAEQEREVARSEAQRARRDAVLARRQISESDALLVHAAYGLLPEADRPPFAEWVDAGIKPGGALHRFVAPAEPEPAGTRARGKTTEPIDPDVLAEATRRKQRGGALYEDVTAEQLARDMQARRASKK